MCVRAATINKTKALATPDAARNHAPAAGAGNLTLIDARLSSRSTRYSNVYPVKVIPGDNGITFLEVLVTGAVQTTTINKQGKAVHSRHTIIAGEFVPSQYYGTCE